MDSYHALLKNGRLRLYMVRKSCRAGLANTHTGKFTYRPHAYRYLLVPRRAHGGAIDEPPARGLHPLRPLHSVRRLRPGRAGKGVRVLAPRGVLLGPGDGEGGEGEAELLQPDGIDEAELLQPDGGCRARRGGPAVARGGGGTAGRRGAI
eukprot:scaffold5453_cov58-Phaeocystis_antarctica.AAC.2